MKNVLIIVDMQNDFIDGALASYAGDRIVNNVVREIASNKYDYFALTRDCHLPNYLESLEGKNLPIKHCIVGTPGWETNKDVLTAIKASNAPFKAYEKNGFGTFAINDDLKPFEKEIESITLVGLCTDICVLTIASILRAAFPNIPMYFVEDACGGTSISAHNAAVQVLECCQIYKK